MISDYFNTTCTVRSTVTALGDRNRPSKTTTESVQQCRLARVSSSSAGMAQGSPQAVVNGSMRVYMDVEADVQRGDLLICEGDTYHVTALYRPNNHHLEADLVMNEVEL